MGTVNKFEKTPISIGEEPGEKAERTYGGYPYALDFSLSIVTPSRLTVSFITAVQGTDSPLAGETKEVAAEYDYEKLNEDIKAAVNKEPVSVYYCGQKFSGYPLKYSIKRSPSGDILSVDYYDASIGYLDNTFVLLLGKDVELPAECDDCEPYSYWPEDNPCEERLYLLGTRYTKKELGLPLEGGEEKCSDDLSSQQSFVLYNNYEFAAMLADRMGDNLNEDSMDKTLSPGGVDAQELDQTFLEAYHGTLRDVLKQWGDRMGFSFYWRTDGEDCPDEGELVFFNLKGGTLKSDADDDKTIIDVAAETAEEVLAACNLLDRTETVSMETTFNRAVAAFYSNQGLGKKSGADYFILLDLLSMRLMGCHTDVGKDKAPLDGEMVDISNTAEFPSAGTGFGDAVRDDDKEWYKEWDDPNYYEVKGGDFPDKQIRRWELYQPLRPGAKAGDEDEQLKEFRDYIRLVKAAALGAEFFKAYIFFKKMAENPDWRCCSIMSIKDYALAQNMEVNNEGNLEGPDGIGGAVEERPVSYFVEEIMSNGLRVIKSGDGCDGKELDPVELQKILDEDKITIEQNGGEVMAASPANKTLYDDYVVASSAVDDGDEFFEEGNADCLVPVVPNLALPKIISDASEDMNEDSRGGGDCSSGVANVRICNGIVVGKDCLSVKLLNPHYEAVQQLYKIQFGMRVGGCQDSVPKKETTAVESDDRVKRIPTFIDVEDGTSSKTPFVFTYVNRYGNSMITDQARHNHVFKQLKTIADMSGRFWFCPELITSREFGRKEYDNKDIKLEEKLLDVIDTSFGDSFTSFDPSSAVAANPMKNKEYIELGGDEDWPIDKNRKNNQVQLNGWDGEEEPEEDSDCDCNRDKGDQFESPENSARPNLEQWIDFLGFSTFEYSYGDDSLACKGRYTKEVGDGYKIEDAVFGTPVALDRVPVELDDDGNVKPDSENKWQLRTAYFSPADFNGGQGYYGEMFEDRLSSLPDLEIDIPGEDTAPSLPKVIIDKGVIKEIVFECRGIFQGDDDGSMPQGTIKLPAALSSERNVFGVDLDDASMDDMDSIRSSNYSLLQRQRKDSCCCTDLDEGVAFIEKKPTSFYLPETVKKQVARLAGFTNLTMSDRSSGTLVKEAAFSNTDVTYSTNLIPRSVLDEKVSPDAEDELDWIVDQIELPGTFKENEYKIPSLIEKDSPTAIDDYRTTCKHVKIEPYREGGKAYEAMGLGIPHPDGEADDKDKNPENVKVNAEIEGCDGFTMEDYVKGREMKIDFVTPSDEDLKVVTTSACGEPLEGEKLDEKIEEIEEKLADFIRKRAFAQITPSIDCSVTIPDVALRDEAGTAIDFENSDVPGVPSVQDGLESFSVRIDGNGVRVTMGISTKRKLRTLLPSNWDQWNHLDPRANNVMLNQIK